MQSRRNEKETTSGLTIRQKRFAEILHSMKTPNQAKAYRLAGYKGKPGTIEANACRLAKNDKVVAYMQMLDKSAMERAERTADEVITELANIAFANIVDYLSFGPEGIILNDSDKLTKAQQSAVAHVSNRVTKNSRRLIFRLHNKIKCLELLGRRFGIFPTRGTAKKDIKPLKLLQIINGK
ncbi:MAG: terminase small subunit [Planctomycetota bacterium]|jgi:phage terminase small subunit